MKLIQVVGWPLAMLGFPLMLDDPRFLILRGSNFPNFGSHPPHGTPSPTLGLAERYNTRLLIETFVEPPHYIGDLYRGSRFRSTGVRNSDSLGPRTLP